jgi:hypothetical protein
MEVSGQLGAKAALSPHEYSECSIKYRILFISISDLKFFPVVTLSSLISTPFIFIIKVISVCYICEKLNVNSGPY